MPASTQTLRQDDSATYDHRTAKVIELVSSSSKGFQEAVENALADARQSTRGITGAHVEGMSVTCDDGRITSYKVNLKLVFGVEREGERPKNGSTRGRSS
jgi:flavin-binding protein dodecin